MGMGAGYCAGKGAQEEQQGKEPRARTAVPTANARAAAAMHSIPAMSPIANLHRRDWQVNHNFFFREWSAGGTIPHALFHTSRAHISIIPLPHTLSLSTLHPSRNGPGEARDHWSRSRPARHPIGSPAPRCTNHHPPPRPYNPAASHPPPPVTRRIPVGARGLRVIPKT